jgi:hypothetical protein
MPRAKRPIHRSLDYDRVEWDKANGRGNGLEVAFAEVWEEENRLNPGLNQGQGILQNLMYRRVSGELFMGQELRFEIIQRDASIAATVVQWLGTNCGGGFLHKVFSRAGYRLLGPSEMSYEDTIKLQRAIIAESEQRANERWLELNRRELELTKRAKELDDRDAEWQKRKARVGRPPEPAKRRFAFFGDGS